MTGRCLGAVTIAGMLLSSLVAPALYAQSNLTLDVYADLRLTAASGEPTWFREWFGKGRYGGDRSGSRETHLRLAEVSAIAKYDITWDLQAFAHVKYDPEQDKPADLVEAFLKYEPVPKSSIKYSFRAGLFFPHISRENVGVAWTTPFTITPSAINSWVGEEVRALGLEGTVSKRFNKHKLSLTAALFGFNDPSGSLLAFRGWGIGDAKVGAFSQVPLPPLPVLDEGGLFEAQPQWVHPVREIDNRVGYYGAVDWAYGRAIKAGAFYYDNRGDPEAFKHKQYAWETRFWNFYLEATPAKDWTILSQYMLGRTEMGPRGAYMNRRWLDVDFDAAYLLLSKKQGDYRFTVRGDLFGTDDNSFVVIDNNDEDGYSVTLAASKKVGKRDTLMLEYLHINSDRLARTTIGFAERQKNDLVQISFRKIF